MTEGVEHLWTILCRGATRDERGLSLVGLMDMIHLPELPASGVVELDVCVASYWRRNAGPGVTLRQRLAFVDAEHGTRATLPGEQEIVLLDRHLFCAFTRLRQLPIRSHGQHMIVVQRGVEGGDWVDVPPTAGLWVASDQMMAGLSTARSSSAAQ